MLQRASAIPPRGPRQGSPSVRGGGRGGIQKRRAGPVRVDKDGDMDMDAGTADRRGRGRLDSAPYSRGSGRGSGGPARGANSYTNKAQAVIRGMGAQQANILESRITTTVATLKVDGLKSSKAASNADGGLESLLGFLERKAAGLDAKSNRVIKIKKSHIRGDSVFITASPEDIAEIAKLDQFMFAGTSLSIQAVESPLPPRSMRDEVKKEASRTTQETKDRFRAILATRYDGDLKLLNLSALSQDPGLVEMGLGAFDGKVTSKLFPAMMVVCDQLFTTWQQKRDAIVSVSLANNGLDNVRHVSALAQTFPHLKNLDLSGNNLADLKSIENWRWKFRSLENLVLTDNPITTRETNLDVELIKWFPKLLVLNGVQVRTSEQIAANFAAANSPIPISGPDFRDVAQVGENFIRQFFLNYDNDRPGLLANYYDGNSLFSISINMAAPRDRENSVAIPPWASYMKHSRNLNKLTTPGARFNRRYKGVQHIQQAWSEFPATRHPDLATQTEKYMIECHPVSGLPDPTGQSSRGVDGLHLSVHGEFEENNPSVQDKALRSFSRTFILGPGGPNGPPITVISDLYALRAFSPLALPSTTLPIQQLQIAQPTPQLQITQASPQLQIAQTAHIVLTPEQQKEAVAKQLMEKTGMTSEYAIMCLEETGWDLEKAYGAFVANKDKLPPNAFIAGVAN